MIEKWFLGILTGSTMVVLPQFSFEADVAGFLGPGTTPLMLLFLGLGLTGLGLWGRGKNGR